MRTDLEKAIRRPNIDWEQIEKLVSELGGGINNLVDEENCVLSKLLFELEHGEDMLKLVRLFLQHGFDVHANNNTNGALCLYQLCWANYDQYSLEIAEALLDAGADSKVILFHDDIDGDSDVLSAINWKLSYWGFGPYITANMFSALYCMVSRCQEGKAYKGIRAFENCIGKTISKIEKVVSNPHEKEVADQFADSIIISCDDSLIQICSNTEVFVNPYVRETEMPMQDISSCFEESIGARITGLRYCTSSSAILSLDNGKSFFIFNDEGFQKSEAPDAGHIFLISSTQEHFLAPGTSITSIGSSCVIRYGSDVRDYPVHDLIIKTPDGTFQISPDMKDETENYMESRLTMTKFPDSFDVEPAMQIQPASTTFEEIVYEDGVMKSLHFLYGNKHLYLTSNSQEEMNLFLCERPMNLEGYIDHHELLKIHFSQ